MKITFTKESFGPYRIVASKDIAEADYAKYLTKGALYEAERTPSTTAEKPYWPYVDKKGNPSRNDPDSDHKFTRNDIPVSAQVQAEIKASFEASGYSDVRVEVRDTKEVGPAWKGKVAAYVGMLEIDDDMTPARVRDIVRKMAAKLGLDVDELLAYAEEKGLPAEVVEAPVKKGKKS